MSVSGGEDTSPVQNLLAEKQQPIHFGMRFLISSAPSDLNVKLLGSLIYEEDYKVS